MWITHSIDEPYGLLETVCILMCKNRQIKKSYEHFLQLLKKLIFCNLLRTATSQSSYLYVKLLQFHLVLLLTAAAV